MEFPCFYTFLSAVAAILTLTTALLPDDYVQKSAQDKQNILWTQIESSPYSPAPLPTNNPSFADSIRLFNQSYLQVVFFHSSDELPPGRKKLVHTYGMVAKVELVIFPNSTYTGLFRTGGIGLIRFSVAKYDPQNIVPAIAVKILVDGQKSQNFFALNNTDGQGTNTNFFTRPISNFIDEPLTIDPTAHALQAVISAATKNLPGGPDDRPESALNLPFYEAASVDANGMNVSEAVRAPYRITYLPNGDLGWDANSAQDVRMQLTTIPENSVLFTLAVSPTQNSDATEIIGQLVSRSPVFGSHYGDENLFFQHPSKRWRS
ncbi:uncharacterized protein LOC129588077 [Paramacrobiotus metropolitanus]|uniref:uncharacterized protein LOC129588077 n=1 Tax=Paramacrobiotus metropolitanus TaxID=2943436 RepID=UPI0024457070|nr:uncharacterized protein LOC129588077 [Paramacrobiotus metropolitanus]